MTKMRLRAVNETTASVVSRICSDAFTVSQSRVPQ
jgi:hypothetical protein